ncbi:ArsR family transcriptional regulator [Verrucomicrobiaceae bacterium N1E253]|uniref:ArsR family transcriptional regulator n=1 Tax=Oceaniferula marina TaxID=2748318 RepID=A0A851GKM8_9BACT|nr:ArsR family transcriptional regulator [Oceaniferula marina]NWK55280.1 ArsR family transcriptional regulator [Oceaniferula marina]
MKESQPSQWNFLTNHTHVLVVLDQDPDARIRDMAVEIGITERAVQRILSELASDGFLSIEKQGRRNIYTINRNMWLRHSLEKHVRIGSLLDTINSMKNKKKTKLST